MALIEIQKARKVYQLGETEIHALKGIDLVIECGEFVAIWGPSGSGKSTLCHLIGVIDVATEGSVMVEGKTIDSLSDNEQTDLRNRCIGFIFQNFNLVPVLTALENVMLPLQMRGEHARIAREKSIERLKKVGLEQHVHHRPSKLSGGQRQRVAIARALVTDPDLVIADEPTANLDSSNAIRIIDMMRDINHSSGTAFIFSTHDERLLERVDRKVHLQDGLIVEDIRSEMRSKNDGLET